MTTLAEIKRTPYVATELAHKAAKEFGNSRGYTGAVGGWIYNKHGVTVTQGWGAFAHIFRREIRDYYTARLTAFVDFAEFVGTHDSYRPTILPRSWRERFLADSFDTEMHARGSSRRAWRGTN